MIQGVLEGVPTERRIGDLIHDFAPMQRATDMPGLWAGLARAVLRAVKADACLVSLASADRKVVRDVAASVVPPARLNALAEEYVVEEFPTTKVILEGGHPVEVSIHDASADGAEKDFLLEMGFARVLICGLDTEDGRIGTIEAYRMTDRAFRQDDPHEIEVLNAFAANTYSRILLASKLESHYMKTIEALTSALEARDPYTQAHTSRIRDLAVGLAVAMQVPDDVLQSVRLGSILHDVGKIGIADSILLKKGPLNDEEWAAMKQHPIIGEQMIRNVDFLEPARPVVRHHHERWDGMGYPDRLREDRIPLGARIVAVCDAYDAMTSDRPYRGAMSIEDACDELLRNAGTQHDPMCTSLLVDIVSKVGEDDLEGRFVRYSV